MENELLKKEIKYVKGVGPNRAVLLNKLGIYNLEDLINYYPRTYEDRSKPTKIAEVQDGEEVLIEAISTSRISEIRTRSKKMVIYKLIARDETGSITITWFNQSYLKNIFKIGETYKFFGKVKRIGNKVEMNSPIYEGIQKSDNTGKIIPIYPLTYNLSQNSIRKIIENGLQLVKNTLEETLPEYLLKQYNLVDINTAINSIHFPKEFKDFNIARKRLVFEELLSMQLALLSLKSKYKKEDEGIRFNKDVHMLDVINKLPFNLTKAQLKVLEEIDLDMESAKPMNRLLQGDVGSRKNSSINNYYI